jgi:hypothetical protein
MFLLLPDLPEDPENDDIAGRVPESDHSAVNA